MSAVAVELMPSCADHPLIVSLAYATSPDSVATNSALGGAWSNSTALLPQLADGVRDAASAAPRRASRRLVSMRSPTPVGRAGTGPKRPHARAGRTGWRRIAAPLKT